MAQTQISQFEVAQYQINSRGQRRPLTLRKSFYSTEVLPKMAKAGGLAWAGEYARLPTPEQRAIVYRMIAQRSRLLVAPVARTPSL